ncbi:MAG: DUF433 domain-containing protein [Aridibacter sp.]|jgi:uncharacterized protein (DUF433 family)
MNKNLTENEIDEFVISQVDDDSTWEEPVKVRQQNAFPIILPQPNEIISEKDILGGTPVFRGTRVPISALLDNLEEGVSLNEFLENFPTVKREQAIQVLEYFKSTLDEIKQAA